MRQNILSNQLLKLFNLLVILLLLTACGNSPKVIEAETSQLSDSPFEYSNVPDDHQISFEAEQTLKPNAFHKVIIEEVLPTSKYVYLKVSEGTESYWLATKKMKVEVGEAYYYRNGLLKTNFQSKEYQRTFEKLYLVSSIVPERHGNGSQRQEIAMHGFEGDDMVSSTTNDATVITIADLVSRKSELAGKEVKLRGTCIKVNAKIMGRNWIHLQDGSLNEYDLVITSDENIPVGHEVTMVGKVSLNKDFGSGYYYELLVENGSLVNN